MDRYNCNTFPFPDLILKAIQMYDGMALRHGIALLGPTCSGKTTCYQILQEALTSLKGTKSPNGSQYEKVHTHIINPKSVTVEQFYGKFNPSTLVW